MNWALALLMFTTGAALTVSGFYDEDAEATIFMGMVVCAFGLSEILGLLFDEDPFDVEMREDEE
jgi:hypothetical protein